MPDPELGPRGGGRGPLHPQPSGEDGIEISLPYADYYLLEGILRVLRPADVDRAIDLSQPS
ncbi:hypothetical protein ACFQ3Z_05295 [Streptomyces nogalater]